MTHPTSLLVHPFGAEPCELPLASFSLSSLSSLVSGSTVVALSGGSPDSSASVRRSSMNASGLIDNGSPASLSATSGGPSASAGVVIERTSASAASALAPNPSLPGGWRVECVVQPSDGSCWDVVSPCRNYYLRNTPDSCPHWQEYDSTRKQKVPLRCLTGSFPSESSARAALAAAEPWPGYVEPEAWREWAKWTDYSSDRGQYESLCGKWRWAYTLGGKWRSIPKENAEGKSRGYSEASESAIHHPPTVPPPDYTPPKPASDGTVDAADVAANAGLYINDDGETFRSDGMGIVTVTMRDGQQHQWGGVHLHQDAPATRFRPLPKPESKPAAMPGEGEPVNPYHDAKYAPAPSQPIVSRGIGWTEAADAWRKYHAASLAAARAEVERMRAERDEARRAGADAYAQSVKVQGWMSEETDKNGKLRSDLAALKVRVERAVTGETIYERTHPTNAPNWRMLSDAHRAWYESVADPTGEKGAGK